MSWIEMGICWSDPPPPPVRSTPPVYLVDKVQPTAPPYPTAYQAPQYQVPQYPPQNYTYAVPYQQQQMYAYYQARPQQYPPQQQQQIGTGTAMVGGFVLGAMMEDILDPTD